MVSCSRVSMRARGAPLRTGTQSWTKTSRTMPATSIPSVRSAVRTGATSTATGGGRSGLAPPWFRSPEQDAPVKTRQAASAGINPLPMALWVPDSVTTLPLLCIAHGRDCPGRGEASGETDEGMPFRR